MSESGPPGDIERFSDNPAIASGHLVSETASGDIEETHIGQERYTLEGKITNDPIVPKSDENNAPLDPVTLGWETSSATGLREYWEKKRKEEYQEKKEAGAKWREEEYKRLVEEGLLPKE